MFMTGAVVVGAGPNGLAAAVTLARRGVKVTVLEAESEIGGGTRSGALTLPGLTHDHCAAVHPSGAGSPFLRSLAMERHGLEWAWPDVDLAHPLDRGDAAVMWRSLSRTKPATWGGTAPPGDGCSARWRVPSTHWHRT